jgi:hypothetical protein
MELLLNLAWLLLALPGYWLWSNGANERRARRVTSLQCLLALCCGLVLLFPVISATDDLHAMRAEMEEAASSKRAVRQAASEKNCAHVNRLHGPAALPVSPLWMPAPEASPLQLDVPSFAAVSDRGVWHIGRAPPSSLLG